MSQKRDKARSASSQTGTIPRIDMLLSKLNESQAPRPVPGVEDGASITGAIVIQAEGEDKAKDADDTPTKSAPTV